MSDVGALQRTILIADVVGSSRLYEELGDLEAKLRIGACLELLDGAAERHDGRRVKCLGDGALFTFHTSGGAVSAGLEMNQRARESGLEVRMGVHRGSVLEEDGDVFGDAVNSAARIANLAKSGEILVSSEIREDLPDRVRRVARDFGPLTLRGRRRPVGLYAILIRDLDERQDQTQTQFFERSPLAPDPRGCRLRLVHAGAEHVLGAGDTATIGRDPGRTIEVAGSHVSRLHARVYCRQGNFRLQDVSANGTFLVVEGQPDQHIRRERVTLHGAGTIYPGAGPGSPGAAGICYEALRTARSR